MLFVWAEIPEKATARRHCFPSSITRFVCFHPQGKSLWEQPRIRSALPICVLSGSQDAELEVRPGVCALLWDEDLNPCLVHPGRINT